MTHRKWTRVLTLAAASVAMLGLGAWLSYEAAVKQDMAVERRVSETLVSPSPEIVLQAAEPVAASEPAPVVAEDSPQGNAPEAEVIRASLPKETRSLFADADASASVLDLRGAESGPVAAVPPMQPLGNAEVSVKPEPVEADALSELPDELTLPNLSDKPVPVTGVPLPPPRPVGLAALAGVQTPQAAEAPQVAPAPQAAAAAAPAPKQVALATPAAPQPAAASDGGALPNIANALAAVTASVGGANSGLAVAPQPEATPVFPEPTGGFKKGAEVYVRIFKREGALELWMKKGDRYSLYKNYPICKWSGKLGPKLAYADYQSPEGFYSVSAKQLNPHSAYHLSFDVGYPNAYDRRHGATGNKIMIHGDCKSVGCFAMTNAGIDEIYGFVASALANGQKEVPVHIFPFRMTEQAILQESGGASSFLAFLDNGAPKQDWSPFWHNLKEGYDLFERSHQPPTAFACGDRYEFSAAASSCARIAGNN